MNADENTTLDEAIGDLYETFRGFRIELPIIECSDAEGRALTAKSLRMLEPETLWPFTVSLQSGSTSTLKYFLPRLLEIVTKESDSPFSPECVFEKISWSDWEDWPQRERRSVLLFTQTWWKSVLKQYVGWPGCADAVNSIALIAKDLDPYLHIWDGLLSVSEAAGMHLADLIAHNHKELERRGGISGWRGDSATTAQLLVWITAPTRRSIVRAVLERWLSDPENVVEGDSLGAYERICSQADSDQ